MKKIIVALVLSISALSMAASTEQSSATKTNNSIKFMATDLIISEYVEGSSNNKAIEIYNGTGVPVNLSNYTLKKQSNGAGDFINPLVVNRTLAHDSTFVIVNGDAGDVLKAYADTLVTYADNPAISFNGNDAVAIFKTTGKTEDMVDVVGTVNTGTVNWGLNMTLTRKSTVTSPVAIYDAAEWDQSISDTFTGLGTHTMDGTSSIDNNNTATSNVVISAYPNPFNPTTSISFTLPQALNGSLAVYNQAGQKVTELFNGQMKQGLNNFQFNAADLNSGVYFCKLVSGTQSFTNKMVLTK